MSYACFVDANVMKFEENTRLECRRIVAAGREENSTGVFETKNCE